MSAAVQDQINGGGDILSPVESFDLYPVILIPSKKYPEIFYLLACGTWWWWAVHIPYITRCPSSGVVMPGGILCGGLLLFFSIIWPCLIVHWPDQPLICMVIYKPLQIYLLLCSNSIVLLPSLFPC